MSDYQDGLIEGFKIGLEEGKKIKERSYMDGYNDGLIEGMKKIMPPPYVPQPNIETIYGMSKDTCPKCGRNISSVIGLVCCSPYCPSFPATSGAVGSEVPYSNAIGANGPSSTAYNPNNYGSMSDIVK